MRPNWPNIDDCVAALVFAGALVAPEAPQAGRGRRYDTDAHTIAQSPPLVWV